MKPQADDLLQEFENRYVHPLPGRTLIVGSRIFGQREDRRKRYPKAIGIDMQCGEGVDLVLDLEEPMPKDLGRFAHIECASVIEHSRRPWLLAANLQRLLKPRGTIYVTAPFIWRIHGYPGDYWRFTMDGVRELFGGIYWIRMAMVHTKLTDKALVPPCGETEGGCPLLPRTQVCGFGVRK